MSAIVQTIIGASAAILGGFVGAWWQTSRADSTARRIRREERREQGLLALSSRVTDVHDRVEGICRAAEANPLTGRYMAAQAVIGELCQSWEMELSALIPDKAIRESYRALATKTAELLPGGAEAMLQYTEDTPAGKAQHFQADLLTLLALIATRRNTASNATEAFLRG